MKKNIADLCAPEMPKQLRYKVYIAGKVSDLPYAETYQKFLAIEQMLINLGQTVVNPMKLVPEGCDWHSAMRICIPEMYKCTAIYLLPDWHQSTGANIEYYNANAMGFKLINSAMICEIRQRITSHNTLITSKL